MAPRDGWKESMLTPASDNPKPKKIYQEHRFNAGSESDMDVAEEANALLISSQLMYLPNHEEVRTMLGDAIKTGMLTANKAVMRKMISEIRGEIHRIKDKFATKAFEVLNSDEHLKSNAPVSFTIHAFGQMYLKQMIGQGIDDFEAIQDGTYMQVSGIEFVPPVPSDNDVVKTTSGGVKMRRPQSDVPATKFKILTGQVGVPPIEGTIRLRELAEVIYQTGTFLRDEEFKSEKQFEMDARLDKMKTEKELDEIIQEEVYGDEFGSFA